MKTRTRRDIETELALLKLTRGDSSAMPALIALWERPLFYYIRRLVESEEDAFDVLQEVWMSVLRSASAMRDGGALPAWLYRTARNAAIDLLRKRNRWRPLPDEETLESIVDDGAAFDSVDALDLHRALGRLSLPHREAITLYFLEDFSLAEIAEITGATLGTVKSRLYYARRALKTILSERSPSHE